MFELWMLYVLLAVIAVMAEVFVPTFFSINFAFAGVVTALISIFWGDFNTTMAVFIVLSAISIIFIKPLLVKYLRKDSDGGFDEQYIGKVVKVIEPITCSSGVVTIYDERWEARIKDGETIQKGCDVKIIGNDGLTLFVEKI